MNYLKALHLIVLCVFLIACTASQSDAQTVYITKTGKKYHRASCQYLRKSQFEITVKEAVNRGYTPCSVCEPPSSTEKGGTPKGAPKQKDRKPGG